MARELLVQLSITTPYTHPLAEPWDGPEPIMGGGRGVDSLEIIIEREG